MHARPYETQFRPPRSARQRRYVARTGERLRPSASARTNFGSPTIDFKAIRISAELDPRQAKTQLKLMMPPRRNRGLPLFIFGSAVVLALFGVVIYMALAGPSPLPLVTTAAPAAPPAPDTAARLGVPSAPVGPTTTAAPVATSAPTEPATVAAPSAPKAPPGAPRVKSAPSRSAPHKAKVVREPWLE